MKIQNINFNIHYLKISNRNYFQNPVFIRKFDSFTFSGNIKKQEEINEEKRKIKELLIKVNDENSKISIMEIIEKINNPNLTPSKVYSRIHSDIELKELWEKVRLKENIKFTPEEKSEFEKALSILLYDAYNSSRKITLGYLCEKIGVSKETVLSIIYANDEYKKLYEQVINHPKIRIRAGEEIASEEQEIQKYLLLAIGQNKKASLKQIGKQMGISETTVKKRILANDNLSRLYEKVKNPPLKPSEEESKNKEDEIRELLEFYIKNNEKVTAQEIIKKASITLTTFYNILSRNQKINTLWQMVKKQEYNRYSENELSELDDFIHRFLLQKREKGETATLAETAKYFEVSKALISKRIQENPSLRYQWDKVKSQSISQFDDSLRKEQRNEIIRILKEIDKAGKKTTKKELAELTGLSQGTVQNRIQESTTAVSLWNKVKSQNYTHYSNKDIVIQTRKIKDAIRTMINENQVPTIGIIAKMTGIQADCTRRRINENTELTSLWQRALEQ